MRQKWKQETCLVGATNQILSNSLPTMQVRTLNEEDHVFLCSLFYSDDAPKPLRVEPEKTPAPTKSGDFQQFSSSKKFSISISTVLKSLSFVYFVKTSL